MSIKTKRQALESIHQRTKFVDGKPFTSYVCYVGTDPIEHKKIMFERGCKDDCVKAVTEFFDSYMRGASPAVARGLTSRDYAELTIVRSILADAGLSNTSLVTIVEDFVKRAGSTTKCSLGDALEKYLSTFSEIQEAHRKCIVNRVGAFVRAMGEHREVSAVTPHDITGYLSAKFGSSAPKTYNNNATYIRSFFAWCTRKDIAFRLDNPADTIRKKTIEYKEPEFVTADKVRAVFAAATSVKDERRRAELVAYLALSFFNGVRAEEIFRLRGSDVNLSEGWVRVGRPKGFQHGIAPRLVPLTDTAKAWLASSGIEFAGDRPLVESLYRPDAVARALHSADRSLSLPRNAGRHSFITMHIAAYGDPRKTEAIVGTSAQMRVNHYQGLATPKQAAAYFGVLP